MPTTPKDVEALVDWEARPAVLLKRGTAYAIVSEEGNWERVSSAEVVDSGKLLSSLAFIRLFPGLNLAAVPTAEEEEAV